MQRKQRLVRNVVSTQSARQPIAVAEACNNQTIWPSVLVSVQHEIVIEHITSHTEVPHNRCNARKACKKCRFNAIRSSTNCSSRGVQQSNDMAICFSVSAA